MVMVHSQLSKGPLVRNVVLQISKFDAKPNPNPNSNLTLAPTLTQTLTLCLYDNWNVGQLDPRTSEPSDNWTDTMVITKTSSTMVRYGLGFMYTSILW